MGKFWIYESMNIFRAVSYISWDCQSHPLISSHRFYRFQVEAYFDFLEIFERDLKTEQFCFVLIWKCNGSDFKSNHAFIIFQEDMRHIEIRIKNNFNETQIICLRLFHKYILRRMKLFTHTYFFAYALSYLLAYTRYSGPKQFDLVWKLYISLHLPTLVCLGSNGPVGPMYSPASTYYQQ